MSKIGVTATAKTIPNKDWGDLCKGDNCMEHAVWWINMEHEPYCDECFLRFLKSIDCMLVMSQKAINQLNYSTEGPNKKKRDEWDAKSKEEQDRIRYGKINHAK